MKKLLAFVLVLTLAFGAFGTINAKASVSSAYSAAKRIHGHYCPNINNIPRKDGLGRYSKIFGYLSTKGLKSYKAGRKTDTKKKVLRAVVIVQAKKKSSVNGIKKTLRNFVNAEKRSATRGYYSDYGKKVLNHATIGSKGKCVYLLMLDGSGNRKAKAAVRRAL